VAVSLLQNAGLDSRSQFRIGGVVERVIAQSPGAGTVVALGSIVTITISIGRFNTREPDPQLGGGIVIGRPPRREP
jgi:beta-lactam-binding protein with PASTA domain